MAGIQEVKKYTISCPPKYSLSFILLSNILSLVFCLSSSNINPQLNAAVTNITYKTIPTDT